VEDELIASEISKGQKNVRLFWFALIVAVIFTIIGISLGDPFEAYQTAATL
jgi:hypothetical protein